MLAVCSADGAVSVAGHLIGGGHVSSLRSVCFPDGPEAASCPMYPWLGQQPSAVSFLVKGLYTIPLGKEVGLGE